jgi:hypothetical protein
MQGGGSTDWLSWTKPCSYGSHLSWILNERLLYMLRNKLAALLAGATLTLFSLVGVAAPAGAAPSATGTDTAVVAPAATSTEFIAYSWFHHSTFEQLWMCKEAGQALIDEGLYQNFSCQYRHGEYELWVLP